MNHVLQKFYKSSYIITSFSERQLDYIFISNCLQDFVNNTDILPALSTDHFPPLISLLKDKSDKNGNGFIKFKRFYRIQSLQNESNLTKCEIARIGAPCLCYEMH